MRRVRRIAPWKIDDVDYSRPPLAERLAAEYVLGTLRGRARRRFETLLGAHPALRLAVADWYARLMPLTGLVKPVAPSSGVWLRVQRRLFQPRRPAAAPLRWWQRAGLWQGAAALATAAAVGLSVLLVQPMPAVPPVVIVLSANPEAAAIAQASFVASVSGDGRSLVLKPINVQAPDAGRALELWAVPGQGAPRSLGLVSATGATRVLRAQLLSDTAAFAVSLEPPGGSPTGAPTGPILSVGKLEI
jgi:anti-sigma-K factor RskA